LSLQPVRGGNFFSLTKRLGFREHAKATLSQTPLTALVVTCNEARRLADCLKSLRFCNERIVIDLESEDESVRIAEEEGVRVLRHRRVPIVEQVRPYGVGLAAHDWVIFTDPDEVIPGTLAEHIAAIVGAESDIGMIWLPCQFYFHGKPVTTAFWGSLRSKPMVFHRRRVRFPTLVHRGVALIPPYGEVRLHEEDTGSVAHFWADSYRQLFEKHRRYLRHEGKSLYQTGQRFAWGRGGER
jgi:glycosyltransferase involved in cell wall biosynthesis